jgi:hypothetical protein
LHPFNALSDAPLQRVIVARLFFFNASFNAFFNVSSTHTLQCVVVAVRPSTRRIRTLHRNVVAPFNALLLCALPRIVMRVSATRLCERHSPHCWHALSRYVDAPFYCVTVE